MIWPSMAPAAIGCPGCGAKRPGRSPGVSKVHDLQLFLNGGNCRNGGNSGQSSAGPVVGRRVVPRSQEGKRGSCCAEDAASLPARGGRVDRLSASAKEIGAGLALRPCLTRFCCRAHPSPGGRLSRQKVSSSGSSAGVGGGCVAGHTRLSFLPEPPFRDRDSIPTSGLRMPVRGPPVNVSVLVARPS